MRQSQNANIESDCTGSCWQWRPGSNPSNVSRTLSRRFALVIVLVLTQASCTEVARWACEETVEAATSELKTQIASLEDEKEQLQHLNRQLAKKIKNPHDIKRLYK